MLIAESMVAALLTGYIGITLVIILTGCGLPIPEELPIVTAGALSGMSGPAALDWRIALPCCIFGALAGDSAIWWFGTHFGSAVLTKHPAWVGFLTPEREKKAEQMITKHGLKLLFVARFLPGIRTPVYLTTGILKMPYRKFILFDSLCACAVVGTCFGLGYAFGDPIMNAIRAVEHIALYIALGVAAVVGIIFFFKHRRRMAEIHAEQIEGSDGENGAGPSAAHEIGHATASNSSGNGAPVDDPAHEKHRTG